jgi:CDP-4-dehydro-6-deoxyglucose reductase, E1
MTQSKIREQILKLTKEYYHSKFGHNTFVPGESRINYAGRVFDENELVNLVDSSLDYWLTEGRFSELFSQKISNFLNIQNVILTNSGSSSNLIAFSALTSEKLGERRLKPGAEVISVAAGFPSTVSPIIQNNCIPVFVDVDLPTYNINIDMMKRAVSEKTKCIFIAHTLGNPFNIDEVLKLAKENNLWVIEDNCDAFGSTYNEKYTGTFGHIATMSFYPAHHITTGEGGAVVTNDESLAQIIRSFRDWGRDCYCAGGENNTCGKRFSQQFGNLPYAYDHKYVYSEIGYNLKMTDMQAAIGASQMDKLPVYCSKRKENFRLYSKAFQKYKEYLLLPEPTLKSDPAWFSYIITVMDSAPFKRDELTKFLNENKIETRNLFAGNLVKQPAFINKIFRIADHLKNSDYIMHNAFFLGTYPGITKEMMDYIERVFAKFMDRF